MTKKNQSLKELREEARVWILDIVTAHKGKSVETIRRALYKQKPSKFAGTVTREGRAWNEEQSIILSELLRWPKATAKSKKKKALAALALVLIMGQPCFAETPPEGEILLRDEIAEGPPKKSIWSRLKDAHPKISKGCKAAARKVRFTCIMINPLVQFGGHVAQIVTAIR